MNTGRPRRSVTILRKNKDPTHPDNYRPIALLNMIWRKCDFILGNRMGPLLNLLTDEEQDAYRPNISTHGALSLIGNDVQQRNASQRTKIDLPESFGSIGVRIL